MANLCQVHPTAIPGADKLRLMSESARGEGGRVWVPSKPGDSRDPKQIPENERYYFLEDRYPEYGNLVPRDIATREIFNVCVNEGRSVESDRQCVYLDLTHIPRAELDRKLAGILEIYEQFQGVDPRDEPMKIFPAVHYSMGGLWIDFEESSNGGLQPGSTRNQHTNIPGLFAIGECDYQYHGANRLGANSLLSCIFSGLFVAPGVENWLKGLPGGSSAELPESLYETAAKSHQASHDSLLAADGGENPYLLHQALGDVMTKACTVVRKNDQLDDAVEQVNELSDRAKKCSVADNGNWTNQNVVFTKALIDMFPLAKTIVQGARNRDECRGAHFKPEFQMPSIEATDPAERKRLAEAWCDRFEENNQKWLKTTVATWRGSQPSLDYEDVDTGSIPPRPRLYGIVGGDVITETFNERKQQQAAVS